MFEYGVKNYGFVDIEGNEDVFIPPMCMNNAINGDKVVVEITSKKGMRLEGRIVKIMKREFKPMVGEIIMIKDKRFVKLDDDKVKLNIEVEIENCKNNEKEVIKNENEKTIKTRRNNISFAQIIPQISAMTGFGLSKEKIKNIILPLIDEFNINENNKKILFDFIENPNHI